jgi:DNA-binding LacI/PurR family transcriptional regulator
MVDSVVSILNERNKPLIVLSGCFDETADKGYDNVLFDFLSADKMGRLMGEYMLKANCSRVALLHTNTAFETDELKGLEAAVADSELLIYDISADLIRMGS